MPPGVREIAFVLNEMFAPSPFCFDVILVAGFGYCSAGFRDGNGRVYVDFLVASL